jgi:hypothetical protein
MGKIKAKQFITLWLEAYEKGEGIPWIAQTIKRPQSTVHSIASTLRRSGVELPSLRRKYIETVNIDEMNKLIREKLGG